MSQTVVLWVLGGWFVLAAIGSVMLAGITSQDSLADASDSVEAPVRAERQADRTQRPRMAA
jgi:hypothetical protein